MTPLQKIVVMGVGLGLTKELNKLLPTPTQERVKTIADQVRLEAAENKRRLKAAKRAKRFSNDLAV